jgi:hypothetical protein
MAMTFSLAAFSWPGSLELRPRLDEGNSERPQPTLRHGAIRADNTCIFATLRCPRAFGCGGLWAYVIVSHE